LHPEKIWGYTFSLQENGSHNANENQYSGEGVHSDNMLGIQCAVKHQCVDKKNETNVN
jgi:hypothetical protein